ncbi:MAG: hypothetical protein GOU97_00215 [Nanoarchaeota archaeon]|nr:hypothetical protein [Nanoarchaeota archaeon]
MRKLSLLIFFFWFPIVMGAEVLGGVLGPAVVVQQANLSFDMASVEQAFLGEQFQPELYLTNVGDGDALITSSELVWTSNQKGYVSVSSPQVIPPGYTSRFSFIVDKSSCVDFSTNQTFRFNITYSNATDDTANFLSSLYWHNISSPLSIRSLSVDTNQVFPVSMRGLDRFTFLFRNDGVDEIDYSLSVSHPVSVFPEIVTSTGIFQPADLPGQSFSISGLDKQVFGVILYPITPYGPSPFELNLTTSCGNTSQTIGFSLEVVSEQAGFFATVPGIQPIFFALLLLSAGLFLYQKI